MSASLHPDLPSKVAALKRAVDIIYAVQPEPSAKLGAIDFPSEVSASPELANDEALLRGYHRLQALFIVRMFNIVIGVSSSRRALGMLIEVAERLREAGLSDDIGGLRRVLSVWGNPAASTRVRGNHERRASSADQHRAQRSPTAHRSP